jgi:hypothetical protein
MAPEVAALLGSIVETNREQEIVHGSPRQGQLKEGRRDLADGMVKRGELQEAAGQYALQCNYFAPRF